MLQAVFAGHGRFVVLALLLVVIVMAATYIWARRHCSRTLTTTGLTGSLSAVLLLTFWGSGSGYVGNCTVNRQISEAFLNDQGLLNVALFVPLGFFGVLALRQPLAVIIGSSALSLTIEIVQATVPAVARTCDSSDWVANSAGGLIGAAVGWGLVRAGAGHRIPAWTGNPRPLVWGLAGTLAANAAAGALLVTPVFMDSTSVQYGSSAMREAVEARVREAFGEGVGVGRVQYVSSGKFVVASVGKGSLQLAWPDNGQFSASFPPYQSGVDPSAVGSISVTEGLSAPRNEQDARKIATQYVREHFPWALPGSKIAGYPVADGRLGWSVSWRRTVKGVLMPMRLDVEIDRRGNLSQLLVREVADPALPTPPKLTEAQAQDAARHSPRVPPDVTIGKGTLAMVSVDGSWRAAWLFPTGIGSDAGPVVGIDAVTGEFTPPQAQG